MGIKGEKRTFKSMGEARRHEAMLRNRSGVCKCGRDLPSKPRPGMVKYVCPCGKLHIL